LVVVFFIDGDNAGSSQAEVVLQSVFKVGNLSLAGNSSQLPREFSSLGESSGSKRMSFAGQTSRWVHNNSSSVSIISLIDELSSLSLLAEAKSFVGDKFVRTEAIMKFDDSNITRLNTSLFES
jgi:hypothetical protein